MFFNGGGGGRISPTSPTRTNGWISASSVVISPFKNTQMPTLPDISLNQTCFNNNGGGKTMKDYEDQSSALQKENFQLKMRVFFLEEKMGHVGGGGGGGGRLTGKEEEDYFKKNIELEVENRALKKEIEDKQELLSQAARAFKLHEEQKEEANRNQVVYQQSLEDERRRIEELQRELEEYKEKGRRGVSIYFNNDDDDNNNNDGNETTTLGGGGGGGGNGDIKPELDIENKEKLLQMEVIVESLEVEVKQLSARLDEERAWGKELQIERDELRIRLEKEVDSRDRLAAEKDQHIECLRERIKQLEADEQQQQAFKRENVRHYKTELEEKERVIEEKVLLLEEKYRAYEEISAIAEKRKQQIDQLRASIKSRDDAIVDSNNKYRTLLNQIKNNRRPTSSSSPLSPSSSSSSSSSSSQWSLSSIFDRDIKDLKKQLEERDFEVHRQKEAEKQLVLKLCNVEKLSEKTKKEYHDLKKNYEKALSMIREFVNRQSKLEEKQQLTTTTTTAAERRNLDHLEDSDSPFIHHNQRCFEKTNEINNVSSTKSRCTAAAHLEEIYRKNQEIDSLNKQLIIKSSEIKKQRNKIESLTRELQIKTQNLQQLVNTELWSRNKEIAKFQNNMTVVNNNNNNNNTVQIESKAIIMNTSLKDNVEKLIKQKNDNNNGEYNDKIIIDVPPLTLNDDHHQEICRRRSCRSCRRSRESVQSDNDNSETFSEPDRNVSLARIGLTKSLENNNIKSNIKYNDDDDDDAGSSDDDDSKDSLDYVPCYKTYQMATTAATAAADILQETTKSNKGMYGEKDFKETDKKNKQYDNDDEKKICEMILTLNVENDALRGKVKKLEVENQIAKSNIEVLTLDLDKLTLSHSQILMENTKLTNEKLRLEQKIKNKKYNIDDNQCQKMKDFEVINKELRTTTTTTTTRKRLIVELNSDSAPSSSGVSSAAAAAAATIPETKSDDNWQEFNSYSSHCWSPINYHPSSSSSSSAAAAAACSPDLGIESDDTALSIRPLKNTLKITESMNNLLATTSDDDDNNRECESPLHTKGLDEVEALLMENQALKKRLMKTRRALEDTFQHLSASNKNKKNVEKAIIKQLNITKNILKKRQTFQDP